MNYIIHRVKYKKSMVISSSLLFSALISALVNVALGMFYVKDVYIGDTASTLDFASDPLSFVMNLKAVIDISVLLEYVISGAVIGLGVGLVLAALICLFRSGAERRRDASAEDIRACLEPVRPIIADGSAVATKTIPATNGSRRRGTLMLTESTLEFYDKDYTSAQRNFLIKLSDVVSVRSTTCLLSNNKITVSTTKASYTFRVPIGTARSWKKYIKAAI